MKICKKSKSFCNYSVNLLVGVFGFRLWANRVNMWKVKRDSPLIPLLDQLYLEYTLVDSPLDLSGPDFSVLYFSKSSCFNDLNNKRLIVLVDMRFTKDLSIQSMNLFRDALVDEIIPIFSQQDLKEYISFLTLKEPENEKLLDHLESKLIMDWMNMLQVSSHGIFL